MNESANTIEQEVERLQLENARLRTEILSLRQFIDSMQNLIDAVEKPLPEAQLMALLSEVLQNALNTINAQDGSLLARTIHEFGKKEGLRCVRKTLLQALSHTQEAFTCETIPHDSL